MTAKKLKVGDKVTCKIRKEAYYSRYKTALGRNPEVFFEPGMVGIVAAVDVPFITRHKGSKRKKDTFTCIDFEGPPTGNPPTTTWRCSLEDNNIKRIKE